MEIETDLESFLKKQYEEEIGSDRKIERLVCEDDYGNREYKLKLVNPAPERVQQLTTQMKFRLEEGNGEAIYEIGVEDNGNPLGLCYEDMIQSLSMQGH
jgi:GTPase